MKNRLKLISTSFYYVLFLFGFIAANAQTATDYYNKGLDLFRKKQYNDALDNYNRAIKLDPNNAYYLYSRGYAYQLNNLLTGFVGGTGTIASSTDGINRSIVNIGKQRVDLNNRLFDTEARYRAQFTALDRIVSGLNNTSSFLTQQLSALTGTTKF